MIKQNKHKIIKNVAIGLLMTVFAVFIYLLVAHQNSFWPFNGETQNQQIQNTENIEESAQNGTPRNSYQSSPVDSPTYDSSNDNDGYIEGKTPIQYEGQTDGSKIHGDNNNEQFRIPEDEL